MFSKLYFLINLLRGIPAYLLVCLSGAKEILEKDTVRYHWFFEDEKERGFFSSFHRLMCRYPCYRSLVLYRCFQRSSLCSHLLQLLFPGKKDLEIDGDIDEGFTICHGHGTVVAVHKAGKRFTVHQCVTVGKNVKPGRTIHNPTIGDDVTIYANAVVAGGITIGDNVDIGAGAVVMKDVPSDSVVIGNPCIIKPKRK